MNTSDPGSQQSSPPSAPDPAVLAENSAPDLSYHYERMRGAALRLERQYSEQLERNGTGSV